MNWHKNWNMTEQEYAGLKKRVELASEITRQLKVREEDRKTRRAESKLQAIRQEQGAYA